MHKLHMVSFFPNKFDKIVLVQRRYTATISLNDDCLTKLQQKLSSDLIRCCKIICGSIYMKTRNAVVHNFLITRGHNYKLSRQLVIANKNVNIFFNWVINC